MYGYALYIIPESTRPYTWYKKWHITILKPLSSFFTLDILWFGAITLYIAEATTMMAGVPVTDISVPI